jgi:4-oxalomesaconate tautomerase
VAQPLASVNDDAVQRLSVEHPSGEFTVEIRREEGALACGLVRTARVLFDGAVVIDFMS